MFILSQNVLEALCLYLLNIATNQRHIRKLFVRESVNLHLFLPRPADFNVPLPRPARWGPPHSEGESLLWGLCWALRPQPPAQGWIAPLLRNGPPRPATTLRIFSFGGRVSRYRVGTAGLRTQAPRLGGNSSLIEDFLPCPTQPRGQNAPRIPCLNGKQISLTTL